MNRYEKIYKIVDAGYNKCYIGSTCEDLSQRMARHRAAYQNYVKNGGKNARSFDLFREFGIDNCKILLLEKYLCQNQEGLRAREGEYQQNIDCVNKNVAGRTKTEYYEDNKQYYLQRCREYKANHKEGMKQSWKKYSEGHKDKLKDNSKQYREEHKTECQMKQQKWREQKGNAELTKNIRNI